MNIWCAIAAVCFALSAIGFFISWRTADKELTKVRNESIIPLTYFELNILTSAEREHRRSLLEYQLTIINEYEHQNRHVMEPFPPVTYRPDSTSMSNPWIQVRGIDEMNRSMPQRPQGRIMRENGTQVNNEEAARILGLFTDKDNKKEKKEVIKGLRLPGLL